MILICYLLGYKRSEAIECCGLFRDMQHFDVFKQIESYHGRIVYDVTFVNNNPNVSKELQDLFFRNYPRNSQ